jgi:signal transduction histidine kinase
MLSYPLYIILYRTVRSVYPQISNYSTWIFHDILKLGVLFTFAYALAKKTNEEFMDLQTLKNNLEQKVDEKTRELRKAKNKIEEINEQRSQYFINVAHETKTPLTLISNYLDRFIKTKGNSRELGIIKENFDKLKNDMVHFLDIEKYEKGLVTYSHNKVIDLSVIIRQKIPLYGGL